jgi:hypothetical protein
MINNFIMEHVHSFQGLTAAMLSHALIPALVVLLGITACSRQPEATNQGLSAPQDPATLPRSNAGVQMPDRKAKAGTVAHLAPARLGGFSLKGGWELIAAPKLNVGGSELSLAGVNTSDWFDATVPGTVLTTLVDQGVYPDPYYGLNNLAIPDTLCRMSWWYRVSFTLPEGLPEPADGFSSLHLDGINYRAEAWMNGAHLGDIHGAFTRGNFDITRHLNRGGENVLAIHIIPPPHPGIPHEQSALAGMGPNGGQLCLDGPTFISSEGWDWIPGIRDRNIGIWQDVRLKFDGGVRIDDPQVISTLPLPDTTRASLTIRSGLVNVGETPLELILRARMETIDIVQRLSLAPGERRSIEFGPQEYQMLVLQNPRLWWPNGYGNPELYTLELTAESAKGQVLDRQSVRFGIRELSYELSIDAPGKPNWRVEYRPTVALASGKPVIDNQNRREVVPGTWIPSLVPGADPGLFTPVNDTLMGPFMVIRVNGQRIFCKGGNWGMDDGMKRVSRERLEPYLRLHRDANFNLIRNWTGESTESVFYELCDEYGMMVWNDFWMSTEGYNLYPLDEDLFLDNARDVVRRFRHHPSVVVWCPRNEGYAQKKLEEGLAGIVASEDGTRLYHGNSRNLNLRPSGPWNYFPDPSSYFTREAGGFNSEMGTASVPTAESIRKFIPAEDLWPIGDVWHYHDLHIDERSTWAYQKEYIEAVQADFGRPAAGLEEFCRRAQFLNYRSHRAMFEAWNSRIWDNTSGLLLWMSHPAWPSMVWQTYTWDYETHGSYFGSRKACEPVHIQLNLPDLSVAVINASLKSYPSAQAELAVYDLNGTELLRQDTVISLPSNRKSDCFSSMHSVLPGELVYFKLMLRKPDGELLAENGYWHNPANLRDLSGLYRLASGQLSCTMSNAAEAGGQRLQIEIANTSTVPVVDIKLNLRNAASGKAILPAYFTDGYFTLLPGERKKIALEAPELGRFPQAITAEAFNCERTEILQMPGRTVVR